MIFITKSSPRFLCRPTAFLDLLESWDVRELYIRKTADLPMQLCLATFPRFHVSWLSDFIFYPKPLYKSLHQSFVYSFITLLPSESGVPLHYSTICLRPPSFRHVDFHFRTYKRDLAILTEWWQQRIAWWELLNAACQIICIRKQQHRYRAYSAGQTVPSTAQIRAEGNNTKCVGKKRFNGSVTHGLRKEHVLRPPLSFWTR